MKLRLKEEPREWMKFTGVLALMVSVLGFVLFRKGVLTREILYTIFGCAGFAVGVSCIRPRWFRSVYRGGMTVSWHVGQVMGRVILTVFFLVAVTPLGLLLRLAGKDLLMLRRPSGDTYWRAAPKRTPFERLF